MAQGKQGVGGDGGGRPGWTGIGRERMGRVKSREGGRNEDVAEGTTGRIVEGYGRWNQGGEAAERRFLWEVGKEGGKKDVIELLDEGGATAWS